MIEVLYDDMMETFTAEQLVMMDYTLTANLTSREEITIRLTFISGSCNVSLPPITVQCEEPPSPPEDDGKWLHTCALHFIGAYTIIKSMSAGTVSHTNMYRSRVTFLVPLHMGELKKPHKLYLR